MSDEAPVGYSTNEVLRGSSVLSQSELGFCETIVVRPCSFGNSQ